MHVIKADGGEAVEGGANDPDLVGGRRLQPLCAQRPREDDGQAAVICRPEVAPRLRGRVSLAWPWAPNTSPAESRAMTAGGAAARVKRCASRAPFSMAVVEAKAFHEAALQAAARDAAVLAWASKSCQSS